MWAAENWKDYELIDTSDGEMGKIYPCPSRSAGDMEHCKGQGLGKCRRLV